MRSSSGAVVWTCIRRRSWRAFWSARLGRTDPGGADVSHRDAGPRSVAGLAAESGVTHVGMESTGVYWRPVYAVLEGHFELVVGNARHIQNVPGRKTDVKDTEWIADLVRHGLIAKSFVPPKPIRELRELLRYRRKLVESRRPSATAS